MYTRAVKMSEQSIVTIRSTNGILVASLLGTDQIQKSHHYQLNLFFNTKENEV